jgi:nucleosome assembly protein 1-like 1
VLDEELEKKIRELTIEFDKKAVPLYDKQNEIIQGRALTSEELVEAEHFLTDEEKNQLETLSKNTEPIKEFWLRAFKNNDILAPEVQEKDEEALKALTSIQYVREENSDNFELIFTFAKNEYFSNTELRKKFFVNKDEEPEKSEGTEIKWAEGKDLTVKTVKKTQKNKKSGAKRTVTKVVPDESFFNFFKDSENKAEDDKDDKDDDAESAGDERIHIDYDVARTLIDEVVPYSVEYFLGVKQ